MRCGWGCNIINNQNDSIISNYDIMDELKFEFFSKNPETGQSNNYLEFERFLELLIEEEDYFSSDVNDIKKMITRIRKIYYDKFGWDTFLIRKAAKIKGRYDVKIVDCGSSNFYKLEQLNKVDWYIGGIKAYKCRLVTYKPDDIVFPNRAGEIPDIYINNHQDVKMKNGFFCDVGHLFAGLDALNNPQKVSPFRVNNPISVDSNADVCTWLGDIATYCAELLYFSLNNETVTHEKKQETLLECASSSDMHGNLDSYVLNSLISDRIYSQTRISGIVEEYYSVYDPNKMLWKFCNLIGLGLFNETNGEFVNEKKWINYYIDQLRITTAFMVFSTTSSPRYKLDLPLKIWKGDFENILELKATLISFIKSLKENLYP